MSLSIDGLASIRKTKSVAVVVPGRTPAYAAGVNETVAAMNAATTR
jgi:hypothetical protein